ncbi:hypothetical protein FCV25MIE_03195 [Fagus crenata]
MILALSRPDPKKNVTTLLKAFGECQPLRELANLTLILGNREDVEEMPNSSSIVLTTVLKLIDKYDLYGQVAYPKHHKQSEVPDIYRLAAKTKATAYGLPMVATKNGGLVDILKALNNGLLVDPHDQKAIADALLKLVADKNLWLECRKNGPKNIHRFSWPEHCRNYLSHVEHCRNHHPTARRLAIMPIPEEPMSDSLKEVEDLSLRFSTEGDTKINGELDAATRQKELIEAITRMASSKAGILRDHLEERSCIGASITSNHPYLEIKMCAARILYRQNLVEFLRADGKIDKRSQCQVDKMETSKSNGQSDSNVGLKRKVESLLLRLFQGEWARNHKYDFVFLHNTVPNWFSYRSFCPYIRVKLPADLQYDGEWMGIAVCAYYTVHKQPAVSSDNRDLTSFLHFYNTSASHRVRLIRYKIFQHSKDIFDESSHRVLVFYIPRLLLRLEECRNIGASFEHNNPGVQVKECGIRLVYEEDVKEFAQTLVRTAVEKAVADIDNRKDVGCSSSLQRIPPPMPKILSSFENIAKGWTNPGTFSNMAGTSRNFSPPFTGLLVPARKGQHASVMSSESLIKAYLQKNFEEGEIFNCCFAEREIPRHPTFVRMNLGSRAQVFQFRCLLRTNTCHEGLVCHGLLTEDNELVTLNQRAFIWVLFIPRMKLAHLWSQSTRDVEFWFESSTQDLSVENL